MRHTGIILEILYLWIVMHCGIDGFRMVPSPESKSDDEFFQMRTRSVPQCEVVPIILNVSPPQRYSTRCNSTEVLTFGCQGSCSSYVDMDPKNLFKVLRNCRCCEPSKYGVHLAQMKCVGNRMLRAPLKFAIECNCRPCFHMKSDLTMLRDLIERERMRRHRMSG